MRLTAWNSRREAFLVLPLVLAFGCGSPPQAPSPTPAPVKEFAALKDEQIVCVTLADTKPGTKPMPSVDPVPLSRSKGHVAHWIFCGDGELRITMKAENPFETPLEAAGKHARSGRPKESAVGKKFPYTITLTTKDGVFTNDPDVEVQP